MALKNKSLGHNISYPPRQQWFSVGIFPLSPEYSGLTGNRSQSASAGSFLGCSA